MLNTLFSFLPRHCALTRMTEILEKLDDILENFEYDYRQEKNIRNTAIDAIITLLTSLKDPNQHLIATNGDPDEKNSSQKN